MNRREFLGITGTAGLMVASNFPKPYLAKAAETSSAPTVYKDPLSGHTVRRLSPLAGSNVLYFTDNAFTPDGRYMVYDSPRGCDVVDMQTFEVAPLVEGPYECMMVSRTRNVAYVYHKDAKGNGKDGTGLNYYEVSVPDGKATMIAEHFDGTLFQSNVDDTKMVGRWQERPFDLQPGKKLAGTDGGYNAIGRDGKPMKFAAAKSFRMDQRMTQNIPMNVFVLDMKTGERTILAETDHHWLNHTMFSPTDPEQCMYCHEGTWQMVDRIWAVNADGSDNHCLHYRTMKMEIAGHEFFSADGKSVWYDLQTPESQVFWLASYELKTGKRIWRHMERNEWSLHFTTSKDGKLIGGDGSSKDQVSHADDGQYIYLYTDELIDDEGTLPPESGELMQPALLHAKKVVDLSKHDYRVEPNVQFSPDAHWLTFKSNMHGDTHVYAVETEKS